MADAFVAQAAQKLKVSQAGHKTCTQAAADANRQAVL
jgi:hypothetical protein